MKKRERRSGNSILRIAFVALSVLIQAAWLLLLVARLNEYSVWISMLTGALAFVAVLKLYSLPKNGAFKLMWIMVILLLPVMGLSLYLLTELPGALLHTEKRLERIRAALKPYRSQDPEVLSRLEELGRGTANQFRYPLRQTESSVYANTKVTYYAEARDALEAMKEALRQAEHFILMEYFIIEDGASFDELRAILRQKAAQGVKVKLMYDDIGSVGYVNWRFAQQLNREGIQCRVFNPALPVLNLFMNHRDHRKITVVDGKVGFTGGFNLADEYFGLTEPYGKWKDTGLRLEGEAVSSLTACFLELWNLYAVKPEDPASYFRHTHSVPEAEGFVQPFGDDPMGQERTAESVYMNLIHHAQRSVWFITPYLIITDELRSALVLAAKRGVDVRIITPGIPDKKIIYRITRSYYGPLAAGGVRIFEYTPGFCHAKQCICDGEIACVGTSNLDFRSLYFHFENNVLLTGCEAVDYIAQDFQKLFPVCREVSQDYIRGKNSAMGLCDCILRLFSPLL